MKLNNRSRVVASVRRFLVFVVGLSMPFNNVAVIPGFSLGLVSSAIYFLAMLGQVGKWNILGSRYGGFLWNIPLYVLLLFIMNLVNYCGYNTPIFPFSTFMCFVLMGFLLAHGLYDRKALSYCLYGLAFGGILMAVFFALKIGVEIDENMRLVMFGENSNALGIYMGLSSMVILNDFILNDELGLGRWRLLFIFAFIPIVGLLVATASRTAFFIFALSVIIIIAFYPEKSIFRKIAFMAFGIGCCVLMVSLLENSDSLIWQRLTSTIEEKNTSGRTEITEALIPYVFESPIWGYGVTGYVDVAKEALNHISIIDGVYYGFSPHNVIVEVLLYTGVIGLVMWLAVWWNIGKEAFIMFRRKRILMPVLMCIPILACVLSGQILSAKWAFILYAYIMVEFYYYRNASSASFNLSAR